MEIGVCVSIDSYMSIGVCVSINGCVSSASVYRAASLGKGLHNGGFPQGSQGHGRAPAAIHPTAW